MGSTGRNRSQGWTHAKIDGHANEVEFGNGLFSDPAMVSEIIAAAGIIAPNGSPTIRVDGSKHVTSIFGDSTVSKVDLQLEWSSGVCVNISLKKSEGGQVWLISVPRFFSAVEHHLGKSLDSDVKSGISLFIGGNNLAGCMSLYEQALDGDTKRSPKIAKQERHQKRLVALAIKDYYPHIWNATIDFLNSNIELITSLSFSKGLAKSSEEAAQVIVYNNAPAGANVFSIPQVVSLAKESVLVTPISAGPLNGGSTLLLPTGFLQMHRPQGDNQLQFHHQYKKVSAL